MPLLVPVMAMESAAAGTRRSRQLASTDENMGVSVSRRGRVARRGDGARHGTGGNTVVLFYITAAQLT